MKFFKYEQRWKWKPRERKAKLQINVLNTCVLKKGTDLSIQQQKQQQVAGIKVNLGDGAVQLPCSC